MAAVHRLALVDIERLRDFNHSVIARGFVRFKLGVAAFADPQSWEGTFYDPQFALLHDCSLARGRP